jgi:hypothetical protein
MERPYKMNAYNISINMTIQPKSDPNSGEWMSPNSYFTFYSSFDIDAQNLTELGPKVDRIMENIREAKNV